ncbi:TonB-dependent receptor [Pseudomonas sp. B21-036]|uniref:TonB-dependent receptor n=1 Tax=Pseudomonas TaxID=286 RepID=UPI0009E8FCE9|nr:MULTISPECIES: TonB-dependent receptor [Pseudomonas]MCP8351347.1 TonB-dependent receptor [Pseudomonas sp. FBF18]MDD1957112.1 TonB-dependent receptor [Pseudomonas sp. 8209]PPS60058.1 TonB-dependent receptor [Pseudomonas sp. BRM28]UVL50752.1 TonB-dependent receptor [Pseudomonas sp. B21-036]WKL68267.1 TonB-dependent receptor [Pseudomonas qingdaonensis]
MSIRTQESLQGRRRSARLLLLSVGLAVSLPVLADDEPARHSIDIARQPLGSALMALGQQTGLQISVESQLLGNLSAPPVRGELSADQALAILLKGSDLEWVHIGDDALLLQRVVRPRADQIQLENTKVRERALLPQGETHIDRELIEAMPAGNGDITSLLRSHPNVQFDDNQLSSKTPGEIAPANISINGAAFYQNAFLVDGINMNNDIDPAEDRVQLLDRVPGRSQGLALDTDLLENITVLDSNVPAAYGGFNGGVIDAQTRAPTKALHGKFSVQTTRSAWTKYHIDETEEQRMENSGSPDEQPEFDKVIVRGTLQGHLTDTFGLIGNFSQKRSTIPLSLYSYNNVEEMGYHKEKQERRIDNYFLKSVWQASDRLTVETSVTHAPEESHYFRANVANSGYDNKVGGTQLNLRTVWDGDLARVEQTLAWSRQEQSRTSDSADYWTWRKSTTKDWGIGSKTTANTLEGGWGDIEQQQRTWQYKLNADWRSFDWLGAIHRPQTGLEFSRQYVRYERLTDSSTYVAPAATNSCTNSAGVTDTVACNMGETVSGWAGQYMKSRTRYAPGEFDFTTTTWGSWVQDEITLGKLTLRPGVRVDSDDYMDKTTWAPRFSLEYDVFGDRTTLLSAGANRYYGRSVTSWQLQDGRNRLRFNETRASLDKPWVTKSNGSNQTLFNQLDIPYDDELMLGVVQQWAGIEYGLKYVNRKGRDQVVQVSGRTLGQPSTDPDLASNYTTYTNDGKSETDTYTLTVTPMQRWTLLGTQTGGQLALNWTDSKASSPSYVQADDTYYQNDVIQYQGSFINYQDRPATNYNRPWTARLTTITDIPQANLQWSNFWRYRAGYKRIGDTGRNVDYRGTSVDVWEEQKFDAALTWDTRLGWRIPTARDQAIFVNVDVFNVLDKKSVNANATVNSNSVSTYEVGRQYWLEVGYTF